LITFYPRQTFRELAWSQFNDHPKTLCTSSCYVTISLNSQLKLGKAKYTTKNEGNAKNRVAPKYSTRTIELNGKTQNKRKRASNIDMNFAINCTQNPAIFVNNP
jgi:hypothetical protein